MRNVRRGLFRLWLVLTVGAVIFVPIQMVFETVPNGHSACFEITEIKSDGSRPLAIEEYGSRVRVICTDRPDDASAFERDWSRITSLKVRYLYANEAVVVIPGAESVHSFYAQAIKDDKRAAWGFVLRKAPLLDGIVLALAVVAWWVGRLAVALAGWIARGFA